jgi:protein TonB
MAQKVNIFNNEWCDILFKDRNKEYGAYIARRLSNKNHFKAIVITIVVFTIAIIAPSTLKKILPKGERKNVEVTELSNLILEAKKIDQIKEIKVEEIKPIKATIKFTPPVIKPDEEVNDTAVMKTVEELNISKSAISTTDQKGVFDDPNAVDIGELNQIVEDTVSPPLYVVEQMPSFPGGDQELRKYIAENVKYPEIAKENGIQGRVFIQFVINQKGKVTNAIIVRGIDPSCDKEALRVIKSMPDWIPGKQSGVPVRVQFVVPVNFVLQ